jgi:hypothetical protein
LARIDAQKEITAIVLRLPFRVLVLRTEDMVVVLPRRDRPIARVVRDVAIDILDVGSLDGPALGLLDLAAGEALYELLEVPRRVEAELEEIGFALILQMEADGE